MALAWVAGLAAVLDLTLVAFGAPAGFRVVTKPLPALLLALMTWRAEGAGPRRLSMGLVAAAAGDELLLRDETLAFLFGMVCFVAMHGFYIASYVALTAGRIKPRPIVNAALTLAVVFVVLTIAPHAGTFAWPLALYSIVLATMVLFASDLVGRIGANGAIPIAAGALVFMTSDTLLAFTKFYPGFPLTGRTAQFAIIATYFAAQILIATGVTRARRSRDFGDPAPIAGAE